MRKKRPRKHWGFEVLEGRQMLTTPYAGDDGGFANYGQSVETDILMNDYAMAPGASIDPTSVAVQDGPQNGTVAIDPNTGRATYTPDTAFSGSDSFTYKVSDTNGTQSGEATVSINVSAPTAPVANNDSGYTMYGQPGSVSIGINDYPTTFMASLDWSTALVETGPLNGTVSIDPCMGEATYTPNSGFFGADSFTYTVNDSNGTLSNEATVMINVAAPPAPVAMDDTMVITLETPNIDVLDNDYAMGQASLDPTSVSIVSGPTNGIAYVDPSTGEVIYSPNIGFAGNDTFSYVVSDSNGTQSNVATVALQVFANEAPVIDWFTATEMSGGVWFFEGHISDESQYDVTVTLSGLVSANVLVESDGGFLYMTMISPGTQGTVSAKATDVHGLESALSSVAVYA